MANSYAASSADFIPPKESFRAVRTQDDRHCLMTVYYYSGLCGVLYPNGELNYEPIGVVRERIGNVDFPSKEAALAFLENWAGPGPPEDW